VERLGSSGDPLVVPMLVGALQDPDADVRHAAARALWRAADPHTGAALTLALRDGDHLVRWAAADALGAIGDRSAVGPLADLLGDEHKDVRQGASEALRKIGDVSALDPLVRTLGDGESDVRLAAADALGAIARAQGSGLAAPGGPVGLALVAALREGGVCQRQGAVWGLWGIGDPWVAEPLIVALQDADCEVRREAANALGALAGVQGDRCPADLREDVFQGLLAVLKRDAEGVVRRAAALALGMIADARAVRPLISALRDKALVRDAAATALEAVTAESFGTDAGRWRQWWQERGQ